MPGALRNLKHEAFAQLIAQAPKHGMSNAHCYREAGYRVDAGPACDVAASRLLSSDKVRARIDELIRPTIRRTRATVDTLAEQLDHVFAGATGDRQWGAAGSAAALKAKLLGFMRERLEVGAVGAFDECRTTEEVIAKLLTEHESPAAALAELDELRQMIEAYAANHAAPVEAGPSVRPRSLGDETEMSLALLRPKHRRR
jgi:hypothetical protein